MTEKFPWYEVITGENKIEQGDILEDWIVRVPDIETSEIVEQNFALMVMTQTCDIEDGISHLIFCPVWTIEQISEEQPTFKKDATIGNLIRGRIIGFYPINRSNDEGFIRPWRIIQFQRIIEIATNDVVSREQINIPRLRLLPPYRESISQAFARYFMRVGLPIPVDTT
ncbi:hypothetical protein ACFLTO_01585 [Chloroflexota bacterium]